MGPVSTADLLSLLGAWGPTGEDCVLADLDLEGSVDDIDLQILLANWN